MADLTAVRIDSAVTHRVASLVEEALSGPANGGMVEQLRIGTVTIDACASRGWGVQFERLLPGGGALSERVPADKASLDAAGAALHRLLAA